MTETLEAAWRGTRSPFSGQTIHTTDVLGWAAFQVASAAVLQHCQLVSPDEPLFRSLDWHCHDGFVTDSTVTDWTEIAVALQSADTLRAITSDDFEVYCAVHPASLAFLWRICLESSEDWPSPDSPILSFDFTGAPEVIASLERSFIAIDGLPFAVRDAKPYFDRRYAG